MVIKEISPNKKDFIIRDLKKDYNNKNFNFKNFYKTYEDFEKAEIEYLKINKKYNLLDYEIIEKDFFKDIKKCFDIVGVKLCNT